MGKRKLNVLWNISLQCLNLIRRELIEEEIIDFLQAPLQLLPTTKLFSSSGVKKTAKSLGYDLINGKVLQESPKKDYSETINCSWIYRFPRFSP